MAAAALILGQNISKTAAALGVERRTVQRWSKLDPEFQSALADSRRELVVTTRQSLLALSEVAVDLVEAKFGSEPNPRVALAFLRGLGIINKQAFLPNSAVVAEDENEKRAQSATCEEQPAAEEPAEQAKPEPVFELADLLPEQHKALESFYVGKTLADVAQAAGTSEETVRNWLCHDECFYTVLSELQFNRVNKLKHRLLKLTEKAVDIMGRAVASGDGRFALLLLHSMGLMS